MCAVDHRKTHTAGQARPCPCIHPASCSLPSELTTAAPEYRAQGDNRELSCANSVRVCCRAESGIALSSGLRRGVSAEQRPVAPSADEAAQRYSDTKLA
jgi:hypothetical protein